MTSASLRCGPVLRAVLWDFGGVILSSPFEAFNHYERERGLPLDTIRRINADDHHVNAWARLERNEVSPLEFDLAFAAEAAERGYDIPGRDVLALLAGEVRPQMVAALDRVKGLGYRTACLTNNIVSSTDPAGAPPEPSGRSAAVAAVMARFDVVVESSKVGVRKPEPRFYEIACNWLEVRPEECVFLDDLGVNLKPAAAMGMRTIKVIDPDIALADLWRTLEVEP
jgi:putative hydrolase of the HAD superfamily